MKRTLANIEDRFRRFCVVGMGNHGRTKLLPALADNGQELAGIVSSQSRAELPSAPVFGRLEDAIAALTPDTVFVLATPPAVHFSQVITLLEAGRDLIVEKPAFVTAREARAAAHEAELKGAVLIEGFMHRHTVLYSKLMECWRRERDRIDAVEMTFHIPAIPAGTFRQRGHIACSSLYDMGCYPLSLLADFDLPFDSLELTNVEFAGDCDREAIDLSGSAAEIPVSVRLGVRAPYANSVVFRLKGGGLVAFSPLFYGRPGDKVISRRGSPGVSELIVPDHNGFAEMFAVPRGEWQASQARRLARLIDVSAALERLGKSLVQRRARLAS
jgi:hypothetical protein